MSDSQKKGWEQNQLRKYDLKLQAVPRVDLNDPTLDDYITKGKPVVITNTEMVKSAEKWTLEYLEEHMSRSDCTVFQSRSHKFKFFDDKKATLLRNNFKMDFTAPTKRVDIKIGEFASRLKEWKRGDDRYYLQQPLNSTVGPAIVEDFLKFKWDFVKKVQKIGGWGPLTSNLLLIAMEGNVTPCHYDEQENLFAQVRGYKRCILFPPEKFECLYPHPVYHPHDRQSQVDFERPNYKLFPKSANLEGLEAVVGPGDVLYIPIYWWHHVESLMRGGTTLSINFWYKAGPTGPTITYPLKPHQKVAVMRNVEKMLNDALADPREVGPLLRSLVLGRYTDEEKSSDTKTSPERMGI